jgi:hypothetical protein
MTEPTQSLRRLADQSWPERRERWRLLVMCWLSLVIVVLQPMDSALVPAIGSPLRALRASVAA